ncbi:MAG: hypothetical protein H0U46_05605 [Actinobacteria bacterium]|nr:hypothetical protein [Actinomycetota bacterium]
MSGLRRSCPSGVHRRQGARLRRVARVQGGVMVGYEEARQIAEREEWYARAEYLGSDQRWWIWQEVEA